MAATSKKSVKEALESAIDPAQLEELVREALSAKKEMPVDVPVELDCPKCKHHFRKRPRVMVPQRDWNAIKNFLQLAIEHSQGKAPTAQAPKAKPKFGGNMDEMTDEQLIALLETVEVDDGEVVGGAA